MSEEIKQPEETNTDVEPLKAEPEKKQVDPPAKPKGCGCSRAVRND